MFISVPDDVRVEVLEVPAVDEGVLVDEEESVDVIPHLYGAEDALVAGVGVGGQEGEVASSSLGVLGHVTVHKIVRLATIEDVFEVRPTMHDQVGPMNKSFSQNNSQKDLLKGVKY